MLPIFRLGKFIQRNQFVWNEFCKNRSQVDYWYENPSVEVIFACYITTKIIQLTLRSKKKHLKPSRQSHIVNGVLTTAFGRVEAGFISSLDPVIPIKIMNQ